MLQARSTLKGGKLLVTNVKSGMVMVPQLKWIFTIVKIMLSADAHRCSMVEHALSCDESMTNMLDACLAFIIQVKVHSVTWRTWPFRRSCIPPTWGGRRRKHTPNWWTQERLPTSRCADECVPIYVYSSDLITEQPLSSRKKHCGTL